MYSNIFNFFLYLCIINYIVMTNKEVALEILRQLGGSGRLNAMLGVKQLTAEKCGISIKYKVASPANYIKITLNSMDLYDVEIGKIRGTSYKIIASTTNIYNDMLKKYIESNCKVYLSL